MCPERYEDRFGLNQTGGQMPSVSQSVLSPAKEDTQPHSPRILQTTEVPGK